MCAYLEPREDGLPMRGAGQWALEKLDYLKRYIDVFETSMRGKWRIRNYVDILAGPGKNRIRETGTVVLGSPLLALTTTHPFTGYYFIDADPENIAALRARCDASSSRERVHIYQGDCNVLVDDIVIELRRNEKYSLNLSFLDPEGLELRWDTVAKLASIQRMDLIINYPEGGLNRLMGKVYESADETPVDRFFGTDAWRQIYADWRSMPRGSIHGQLIDLYRSQLGGLGYQEIRSGDEIGLEPLMRNVKRKAPLYRLLFASKHPLGRKFWREITRRDLYGQGRLFE